MKPRMVVQTHKPISAAQPFAMPVQIGQQIPSLFIKSKIDHLVQEVARLEEEKLAYREREANLEELFDVVGDYMTVLDPELTIVWANRGSLDMFGEQIVGRKCHQIYHGREQPCPPHLCPAQLTFATQGPKEYDTQALTENGTTIDLHCTFNVALRDRSGKPSAVLAVGRNITTRAQNEKISQKSRREWEQTFDAIGDLVAIHDPQGRILRCNRPFQEATDRTWSELIGRPCTEFFCGHPPKECAICPLTRTLADGSHHSLEIPGLDPKTTFLVSTYPIVNDRKKVEKVIRIVKDISVVKDLEAQVRHAQKMEAIGTLAGGIVHDLNNVLAAIHGFVDLTLNAIPAELPQCHENLKMVMLACNHGEERVKQLLTFARRNDRDRLQPVQLAMVINETLQMIRPSIPKNIEIREIIECESAAVLADPNQICQVLMNLSHNGWQAMNRTGGVLELRLSQILIEELPSPDSLELPPGLYCLTTIKDSGEGMDAGTMAQIFEPFFTTKAEGVGTGMGLAVAHGIVRSHRGAIKVRSEKGQGSTFEIYLPALPYPKDPPAKNGLATHVQPL